MQAEEFSLLRLCGNSMNARQASLIGLGIAGVAFLLTEAPALANRQAEDTWSEIGNGAITAQPVVAVALGATAAHIAGGIPAAHRFCARHPLVPLGLGLAVGALCWPTRGLKD